MIKKEDALAAAKDFLALCRAGKFRMVELLDIVIRANRLSYEEVGTTPQELDIFWQRVPFTCYECEDGVLMESGHRQGGRIIFKCAACGKLELYGCTVCNRPSNAWADQEERVCMICGVGQMFGGPVLEALRAKPASGSKLKN